MRTTLARRPAALMFDTLGAWLWCGVCRGRGMGIRRCWAAEAGFKQSAGPMFSAGINIELPKESPGNDGGRRRAEPLLAGII